jgi:hypothetical protein
MMMPVAPLLIACKAKPMIVVFLLELSVCTEPGCEAGPVVNWSPALIEPNALALVIPLQSTVILPPTVDCFVIVIPIKVVMFAALHLFTVKAADK